MDYPPITVGVVTHKGSFVDFSSFLRELYPALNAYPIRCQLVVVNNSGEFAAADTQSAVALTSIDQYCDCDVIASFENNIAVGRNIIFKHAQHDLVALIDDDEFPSLHWLINLAKTHHYNNCGVVAGPAHPLYLFDTAVWIRNLDLHNAKGKYTNQKISNCPTANVLIDRTRIVGELFNPQYGLSGGEDSEFFLRQRDSNVDMRWCNEAPVFEYIPNSKSTPHYMIKRCILQGALNRRILTMRGDIPSQSFFVARSIMVFAISIIMGTILLVGRHKHSGHWLKRAFSNLGHFWNLRAKLYSNT